VKSLELKVPPVAVVIVLAGLMWGIARLLPALTTFHPAGLAISIALAVIGVGFAIAGVYEFRRARTTVDPREPGKSSAVVTSGIYRFTRNPMYLGFLLLLVAWAVYLSNVAAATGPVFFVLYMNRFQIAPEERILRSHFGAPYEAYLKTARRWL
jgi:protein-S-isoprenylcysteine O-methyltransferase Ste14